MADRTFRGHDPYRIAVIGVVAIAAVAIFAYAYGTLGLGQGGYTVSGVFAGTGGLESGDNVQLAGVRVGTVQSVTPDFAHGTVVITWKVNDGVDLGPQTHADIEAANLLGGQYIKLSGPVVQPYLHAVSSAHRRIPLDRTSIPYTLNQAINSSTNLATKLDTQSVNQILKEAAGITPPNQAQLSKMLTDLGTLTTTLNQRAPEVEAIIANSKKLTATLAAKDKELGDLLTYGQNILNVLQQRRNDLSAALGNGSQVVSTLDQVISRHQTEINTILDDLHLTLTNLTTGKTLASMNTTLAWLGPTFGELSLTRGNGRWLEGGLAGLGPLQPSLFGPEPNYEPPNYPYPGVPTTPPTTKGGR
jgi:phospholipid/cholesterol/gamma-HCH transport system substrate-binding protein